MDMKWYEYLAQLIAKLHPIDQFLLCILVISLVIKLISALMVPVLSWWITSKNNSQPCEFLEKNGAEKYTCTNTIHKRKYFDATKRCPRSECHGYQPKGINVKGIIDTYRPLKIIYTLSDWVAQCSSVILIVRTLLEDVRA